MQSMQKERESSLEEPLWSLEEGSMEVEVLMGLEW